MARGWLADDRGALAVDRILDAAGAEFAARGVRATSMQDVARAAGCSRATLYNHFSDRRALDVAFVHREALRLAGRIAVEAGEVADPAQRATMAIVRVLEEVRADPRLVVWFSEADVGVTTAISADSEVLDAIAVAFAGRLGPGIDRVEVHRRARWVVRLIVSLLSWPLPDREEERRLVEDFAVPALLAPVPDAR